MIRTFLEDKEDRATVRERPHLSHSQIARYLLCPEQYRLWYIEHLRPKTPSSSLVFGQLIHQAIAEFFSKKADPVSNFEKAWAMIKSIPLAYKERETWESLQTAGRGILEKFVREELPKFSSVRAIEKVFHLRITSIDLPLTGIIDLVAVVEDREMIVDWKTAGAAYGSHQAALSDQLTLYQLAEPSVESLALCVLVKTKTPKIEWFKTRRTPAELAEFLVKAGYVARDIQAGRFFKRPGMHCSWCDFLPICLGDQIAAANTLLRVR